MRIVQVQLHVVLSDPADRRSSAGHRLVDQQFEHPAELIQSTFSIFTLSQRREVGAMFFGAG
jgi:hypothetical protein